MYYNRKTRKLTEPMQGTIIACFSLEQLLQEHDCVLVDARAAERSDLELNARGEPVAPLDSLAGVVAKAELLHFLNEDIVLQDAVVGGADAFGRQRDQKAAALDLVEIVAEVDQRDAHGGL